MSNNIKLAKLLLEYLEKYPNQRFGQALVNLDVLILHWNDDKCQMDIQDPYYERDGVMLERAQKAFDKIANGEQEGI